MQQTTEERNHPPVATRVCQTHQRNSCYQYTLAESLSLIDADGRFTDKRPEEEIIIRNNYAAGTNMAHCIQINNLTRDCFERLQVIADSYVE